MIEQPLLTDEELTALYHDMNPKEGVIDVGYVLEKCRRISHVQHERTMDAVLHPEWKDKPDSEGLWKFKGKWLREKGIYIIIIYDLNCGTGDQCMVVGSYSDGTLFPLTCKWGYRLDAFKGKWTKALVPEVKK